MSHRSRRKDCEPEDFAEMRELLRRDVFQLARQAVRALRRAVAGKGFVDDSQDHACRVVATLARCFVVQHSKEPAYDPHRDLAHPRHSEEESLMLLERLEYMGAHSDLQRQAAFRMEEQFKREGPVPGCYNTAEEAWKHGARLFLQEHPYRPPPDPHGDADDEPDESDLDFVYKVAHGLPR